jgi:hypothetical protein
MFSLKIRTRLILNIILFGGSLGVISWGLTVHNSVNEQIQVDKANASEILVNTLQLRRAEKDYMLRAGKDENYFATGEIKYIGKFDGLIDDNILVLEELKASEIIREYDLSSKIDSVEGYFDTYQEKFNQITSTTFERGFKDYGMVGEMRSEVHGLDELITEDRHLADGLSA